MKINWGTGIVIGLALFMSFILYFVIRISTDKTYDYDLVTEEYYKRDLAFQNEIDAQENSNSLVNSISGLKTAKGYEIKFPENIDYSKIEGTVYLYRPSNKKLDFTIPLKLSDSTMIIEESKFVSGRWNTIVQWRYEGKNYLYKEEIVY